jgi:TolA-binding protein
MVSKLELRAFFEELGSSAVMSSSVPAPEHMIKIVDSNSEQDNTEEANNDKR